MKRFLVEWHEASGIPDVVPQITLRDERVAVVGAGPAGIAVARELAVKGYRVTGFDTLLRDFDGIAICAGAMDAVGLDIPGAELAGVQYGVHRSGANRDPVE